MVIKTLLLVNLALLIGCAHSQPIQPKPTVAAVTGSNSETKKSITSFRERNHETQQAIDTGSKAIQEADEDLRNLLNL